MVDHTHYYLHLFDAHGRGRVSGGPQVIDPVAGSVLQFWGPPTPALEVNAVVTGRTSGACGRITQVLSASSCVIETIPRTAAGLAFVQNNLGGGLGETIDLDNAQGTGAGYLVNNAGGYAIGATSIRVDTGLGTMLVGDGIKFAGHSKVYNVATALSAGVVVITPALVNTVADNEAVTVRGGEAVLLPLAVHQQYPAGNQFLSELHDSSVTAKVQGTGAGDWPYWDSRAKVCELILAISGTGTFRKGDEIVTSSGGRFTLQVVLSGGGGAFGFYVTRKRGTVQPGDTLTNITTTGSATLAALNSGGLPITAGGFVPYSPLPNVGGTVVDDQFWEVIPQGNGGGVGPDAHLMHLLEEYHNKATSVGDRGFRMIPFSSQDLEGGTDGQLGGVVVQVVKCSGTFPLTGSLGIGQTVTGPNSWSATVHGWNATSKLLFVRATNGALLGAGTLTLSGGATVTGTGPALGWAKGSTHWNNLVAEVNKATTAFGALRGTAPILWRGVIAQPWETEINLHHPTYGCPYVTEAQFQQGWIAFVSDLRTFLGDQTIPVCTWKNRDEQHLSDVYIQPGVSVSWYQNTLLETLPVVIPRLTLARALDWRMSDDQPNYWLRTRDYLDLGTSFFRHLQFGQIDVNAGSGFEDVAVGVYVGQSQMTGYVSATGIMAIDRDPELWSSSAFPGADTRDPNALLWNPNTQRIEVRDIVVNGGNGSWGTSVGTCGPDEVTSQRMKRRFSSDPVQSVRFVSFKFTVPGSSLSPEVIDSTGCWDPSLSTRPATSATCTVSVLSSPARGRFTATAGTFTGPQFVPLASVKIAGSALGNQGVGGNNSAQWAVQQIYAVAVDGSWLEVTGTFVVETRAFTVTVGPPPIWPEFLRQWTAFMNDCQRLGIVPRVQFIAFEQGESDLDKLELYEASLRRVWAALVATCAKRLKGQPAVAKCITLLHKQTPFMPLYGTGTIEEQRAAGDARVASMREIQTRVAGELGNCVVVDPSDLSLEINQFGDYPRLSRPFNGVHHTALAMIQKGYRMDAALATLGEAKGIPAHPKGEVAVDFGVAVDGGTNGASNTGTDGVDGLPADGGTDGTTTTPAARTPAEIVAILDAAIASNVDVAAYTVNGRFVQLRGMGEILQARRYYASLAARAAGVRNTRVRFLQ